MATVSEPGVGPQRAVGGSRPQTPTCPPGLPGRVRRGRVPVGQEAQDCPCPAPTAGVCRLLARAGPMVASVCPQCKWREAPGEGNGKVGEVRGSRWGSTCWGQGEHGGMGGHAVHVPMRTLNTWGLIPTPSENRSKREGSGVHSRMIPAPQSPANSR